MLTRIRNAIMAHKDDVVMPASNLKERIADILLDEGYVDGPSTAPARARTGSSPSS